MMKLYRIYYVLDEDEVPLPEPLLYGLTNKKSIIKLFEKQRSSKFYTIKVSEMSDKEAFVIMDNCKSQLLTTTKFHSKYSNIDIVCTRQEEADIVLHSQDIVMKEIRKHMMNPNLFKKSLLSDMKELDYLYFYKFFNPLFRYKESMIINNDLMDIDELDLFIFKYGWSLKKK